ncbi:oligosaccharide flippase family protein [Cellulosilyticum ruminicola]|uniref:oligosaccharide flippase family protein n=1 Tax=Cellulosilyticum ruminicola TaxID=425254 RepID=UPI000AD0C514|nr:oligosaccharide flippase family protein [Cellulosilyticum ruminicola]
MSTKNMTDMTVGSPIQHIFRFAWPLLIGNLFQQLYNMVDSLIVGRFVGANAWQQ